MNQQAEYLRLKRNEDLDKFEKLSVDGLMAAADKRASSLDAHAFTFNVVESKDKRAVMQAYQDHVLGLARVGAPGLEWELKLNQWARHAGVALDPNIWPIHQLGNRPANEPSTHDFEVVEALPPKGDSNKNVKVKINGQVQSVWMDASLTGRAPEELQVQCTRKKGKPMDQYFFFISADRGATGTLWSGVFHTEWEDCTYSFVLRPVLEAPKAKSTPKWKLAKTPEGELSQAELAKRKSFVEKGNTLL